MLAVEKIACRVFCVPPGSPGGKLKLWTFLYRHIIIQIWDFFKQRIFSSFTIVCVYFSLCILSVWRSFSPVITTSQVWDPRAKKRKLLKSSGTALKASQTKEKRSVKKVLGLLPVEYTFFRQGLKKEKKWTQCFLGLKWKSCSCKSGIWGGPSWKSKEFWSSAIERSWKTFQRHWPKVQKGNDFMPRSRKIWNATWPSTPQLNMEENILQEMKREKKAHAKQGRMPLMWQLT